MRKLFIKAQIKYWQLRRKRCHRMMLDYRYGMDYVEPYYDAVNMVAWLKKKL